MNTKPDLPMRGGCSCGSVRYEVDASPYAVMLCHCTDCQRLTGSAYSILVPVPRQALKVVSGTPARWQRMGSSGNVSHQVICPDCGVRLFTEPEAAPEVATLRGGTLDDRSWLVPVAQQWTQSALGWALLGDVISFERDITDFPEVLQAWKNRD